MSEKTCNNCAKNWKNQNKIDVTSLKKSMEDCTVCKRNNFALYAEKKENEK